MKKRISMVILVVLVLLFMFMNPSVGATLLLLLLFFLVMDMAVLFYSDIKNGIMLHVGYVPKNKLEESNSSFRQSEMNYKLLEMKYDNALKRVEELEKVIKSNEHTIVEGVQSARNFFEYNEGSKCD